jgi:cobalt-zinc-cadmium efflux system membrane fusion protein
MFSLVTFTLGGLALAGGATSCNRTSARAAEPVPPAEAAGAHLGHDHAEHAPGRPPAGETASCAEHAVPESECAICRPDDALRLTAGQAMKVRLPDPKSAELLGIEVAPAQATSRAEAVRCFAEITFDQNRLAQITVPADGIVHHVAADLGEAVREDQLLAAVSSAEITATVVKAVLSHQTLERERKLRVGAVTSEQALQEAEAAHRAACQQALTYGFGEARIAELGRTPEEPVYLELRAPFAGEVVGRSAIRGARVAAGASLFAVADRSAMWAMLHVPEPELACLQAGQEVELEADGLPGQVFRGRLTWVAPAIDPDTRLGRARAEIPNPDGRLRDRMFGRARVRTGPAAPAVVVPAGAVQRVERRSFIFVQRAPGLFDARAIETGPAADGWVEIRAGLAAAEPVAITHTFALKSAMLMSRLGEGCADD